MFTSTVEAVTFQMSVSFVGCSSSVCPCSAVIPEGTRRVVIATLRAWFGFRFKLNGKYGSKFGDPAMKLTAKKVLLAVISMSWVYSAGSASASLITDDVFAKFSFSNGQVFFNTTKTVGPGIEFTDFDGGAARFDLDVEDNFALFRITNIFDGGLGIGGTQLLEISDLDWVNNPGEVIGVTITQTVLGPFPSNNPSFVGSFGLDSVTVDFQGPVMGFSAPGEIKEWRINILTRHASPIPEPTSLTLLAIGAVSLVGYGWRRKRILTNVNLSI